MWPFTVSLLVGYIPLILTGVFNMMFCKSRFLDSLKKPIDKGKVLKDGKRLFGDHKTVKGFIGYIVIAMICSVIWGLICSMIPALENKSLLYVKYDNTVVFNSLVGGAMGFLYALFELPNSFAKRRCGIESGSSLYAKKSLKYIFGFLDQSDSLFGSMLILFLVYPMNIGLYLYAVLLGAGIHMALNILLYVCKLRQTII